MSTVDWRQGLGKDIAGSRPRCVLLTDGTPEQVADRLAQLLRGTGVTVSPHDHWQPQGTRDVREAQLDKVLPGGQAFLHESHRQRLKEWWLARKRETARTPLWDVAATCDVSGHEGLLLVEAKAHVDEIKKRDACDAGGANRCRIERAVKCANAGLGEVTGGTWSLSIDHHFQLSNRFAWAWKVASLGVPVVLLYLGFLNAEEMPEPRFCCENDWRSALREYCRGVVDVSCWNKGHTVQGTTLLPLVRVVDVPFDG